MKNVGGVLSSHAQPQTSLVIRSGCHPDPADVPFCVTVDKPGIGEIE